MINANKRYARKSLLRCPVGLNQNNNLFNQYECASAMCVSCFKQINDNKTYFIEDLPIRCEISSQDKRDTYDSSLGSLDTQSLQSSKTMFSYDSISYNNNIDSYHNSSISSNSSIDTFILNKKLIDF